MWAYYQVVTNGWGQQDLTPGDIGRKKGQEQISLPQDANGCPVHNRLWPGLPARWPQDSMRMRQMLNSESILTAELFTLSLNSLEIYN